jgi:hypothetical protein
MTFQKYDAKNAKALPVGHMFEHILITSLDGAVADKL